MPYCTVVFWLAVVSSVKLAEFLNDTMSPRASMFMLLQSSVNPRCSSGCCPCTSTVTVRPAGCIRYTCPNPPPCPFEPTFEISFPPAPWDKCVDDFKSERGGKFNRVDSTKVIATLSRSNQCLHHLWKRVLINQKCSSTYILGSIHLENLLLQDACVIPTNTVNVFTEVTAECFDVSSSCFVSIPCVTPRVLLTYDYILRPKGTTTLVKGRLVLEVKNEPVTLKVSLVRGNRGVCVLENIDETALKPFKYVIHYEQQNLYIDEINRLLLKFAESEAVFELYKRKVKTFAFEVINEAFREEARIFLPVDELKGFCKEIRIKDGGCPAVTPTVIPAVVYPTVGPILTTVMPTTAPTSLTCIDDYHLYRGQPFNVVETTTVITTNNVNGPCLKRHEQRVLIQSLSLTNSFSATEQIQDLLLSDGCLVQSNTVFRDLQPSLDCTTGSFQCKVTIPCVVPRVLLTYYYKLAGIQQTPGLVMVDVHDGPMDLVLRFARDNNDKCTVLNELDDVQLAKYRVAIKFKDEDNQDQYQSRVKIMMEDFVRKGWPYNTYKEEVKQFLFDIFVEFYNHNHNIFYINRQQLRLKQYCKSLTIQPDIHRPTTSPETHTVAPITGPIFPTSIPTTAPEILTIAPLTGPTFPTIMPTTAPTSLTCIDDYHLYRGQPFNVVETTTVITTNNVNGPCLKRHEQRVLIQSLSLTNRFSATEQIQDLLLSDGCLVQSNTVFRDLHPSLDCTTGSFQCKVTIPCVVPRVLLTYYYKLAGIQQTPGLVMVDVHDGPIDLVLRFVRDNNDKCTVLNELDDVQLAKYRVPIKFKDEGNQDQYQSRVKIMMEDFVRKGWPYNIYKEEVKQFLFEILVEFYNHNHNIFYINGQQLRLKQYCKSLTIQPDIHRPTTSPETHTVAPITGPIFPTSIPTTAPEILTIAPLTGPTFPTIMPTTAPTSLTCIDDYHLYRGQPFNVVETTTVITTNNVNGPCLKRHEQRVLIQSLSLTNSFSATEQIQDLLLSDGCLVQSNTVFRDLQPSLDCTTGSFQCKVAIPCVVPRVLLTYYYKLAGIQQTPGLVMVDVHDGPIDLVLRFVRDNNDKCTVLNELDDVQLAKYRVVIKFKDEDNQDQYQSRVKIMMEDFVRKGWPYNIYKEEVKQFLFEILVEFYNHNHNIFYINGQQLRLKQYCKSLTIQPDIHRPTTSPETHTVAPITGPIFPTSIPTTAPEILTIAPITVPTFPTIMPTTAPTSLTCIDDYHLYRGQPFNVVETTTVITTNNVNGPCLKRHEQRVLIQSLSLTNSFSATEQIQNLLLSDGCLVQSNTVFRDLQPSLDCTTGSFQCKVTIPCVVPRVLLTYYYKLAGIQQTPGLVMVDVHDGPIDLVLRFVRDNNDKCTVLNELDDVQLAKYRVVIKFKDEDNQDQYQSRVKIMMEDFVRKGWPYNIYKEEVKQFLFEILVEFYNHNHNIFYINGQQLRLKQYCKSLTIQPDIHRPTTSPETHTVAPITGPIFPTSIPTTAPEILTIAPLTGPTFPTIMPTTAPTSLTCIDDYHLYRGQPFNVVETTTVITTNNVNGPCLKRHEQRVLIQSLSLTNRFSATEQIQDLLLSDGCLVQSNTVFRDLHPSLDCTTGSFQCKVTIPCVVPRVLLTYYYKLAGIQQTPGLVMVDVHDGPIDLVLRFVRDNNDKCTVLNELDDVQLAKYRVAIKFKDEGNQDQYQSRVKIMMEDFVRKGWPYNIYKEEVKQFLFEILVEFYNHNHNIFYINGQQLRLKQYCKSLTIQPDIHRPTTSPETHTVAPITGPIFPTSIPTTAPEILTIAPLTGPTFPTIMPTTAPTSLTCIDDYHLYRGQPFNVVETTTVITTNNVNGPCLKRHEQRVLIQSLSLTNSFSATEQIQDLLLSDGCLVQSNTVFRDLQPSLDCTTGSFQCKVAIPCVVPRVLLTYYYKLAGIQQTPGLVMVDVHDGPIDLVLRFVRDNNDKCTVLNELDDVQLAKYRVVIKFKDEDNQDQYQSRVKIMMEDFVRKGWPYNIYKEEVKQFLFEILVEFYNHNHNIFYINGQQLRLKQYCKSLTIQPDIHRPTTSPETHTVAPITGPIFPTSIPTTAPEILTIAPLTGPTFPTIMPTTAPTSLTCIDDYHLYRGQPFNVVETTTVITTNNVNGPCLKRHEQRVLIQSLSLTNSFSATEQIQDLLLSDGCLVQSNTVFRDLHPSLDCTTGSFQCKVTIPCVVPRVLLTYYYKLAGIQQTPGLVMVDVHDGPIDLVLRFVRDNNDKCTVLNELDDVQLAKYRVAIKFKDEGNQDQYQSRVKIMMEDFVRKGWPYNIYKEEVKQFLFEILVEFYNHNHNIFYINGQQPRLKQYCKSLTIQPDIHRPTTSPETHTVAPITGPIFPTSIPTTAPEILTIAPITGPTFPTIMPTTAPTSLTCIDDYHLYRGQPFNVVETTTVITTNNVNGPCLKRHEQRVLIQSLSLTNSFSATEQIQNLLLSDGCLVQSNTVFRDLQPSLDCTTGSFQCKVTIPCVVPRVLLTYYYKLAGIQQTPGLVMVDVHDGPIDLVLRFVRDNNDKCTVLNELDDVQLAKYRVVIKFKDEDNQDQYQSRVKIMMEDFVRKGWPYNIYKEEVKQFLFEILVEFYNHNHNIFYINGQQLRLKQYCKSLTIQPDIHRPTTSPETHTVAPITGPIFPTSIPTTAPEILTIAPLTGPTFPTIMPTTAPTSLTCIDDYHLYRGQPFNVVETTTVITTNNVNGPCLKRHEQRVLIQSLSLTNSFSATEQIQDLLLSDGCLVQSNTVFRDLQPSLDCTTGSFQCKVTIPCVVPRVLLTYYYKLAGIQQTPGLVMVDVHDGPIDLVLRFVRDNNDKCTVLNELDDVQLAKYRVVIKFKDEDNQDQYQSRVKIMMEDFVRKGWPYNTYKEEVKQFLFEILVEFYNHNHNIFYIDGQQLRLKQYCKSLTIQPDIHKPTTSPESLTIAPITGPIFPTSIPTTAPEILTIAPITGPTFPTVMPTTAPTSLTCIDDYHLYRGQPFNVVETTTVITTNNVNGPCLKRHEQRVLIQSLSLTNSFSATEQIQDLLLSDGCLVQSNTVFRDLQPSLDCTTGSFQCKVTIPCVVPSVLLTYYYKLAGIQQTPGLVMVDVHDGPIDLVLRFVRDNNDKCTVLNELDDVQLAKYRVVIKFKDEDNQDQYQSRVKIMMEDFVRKGLPYNTYKEEVKQFLFEIFVEFYYHNHNIFYINGQQLRLKQYCKSLTIQPSLPPTEGTTSLPPPVFPTTSPLVLPVTCKDEYMYNRTEDFNIINPPYLLKPVESHECVDSLGQIVVIRDRQLSPYFQKALLAQSVYLSNGCLVQSITVPHKAPLSVDCQSRPGKCSVTIPCITPKIVIGYNYKFSLDGENVEGTAVLEVRDIPSTIQVTINTNSNRMCTISNESDKKLMPTLQVSVTLDREMRQVSDRINQFIHSNSWLSSVCEQEMRAFTIRVVQEAFSQSGNVFPIMNDLHQFCDLIVEAEIEVVDTSSTTTLTSSPTLVPLTSRPTPSLTPTPTPPLTPTPTTDPRYNDHCGDDYSSSRRSDFNIINPRRVVDIISKPFHCIGPDKQRVIPGKRLYSPSFKKGFEIGNNLHLNSGCLIQSVTFPLQAQLKEDCSTDCVVTVPCVVPRILIGYSFEFRTPSGTLLPGKVIVEVHDDPLDIPVLVKTESCEASSIVDDISVLNKFKVTVAPDQRDPTVSQQVKTLMIEYIQRTGWPFEVYAEEVKHVMKAVINEGLRQSYNVFGPLPRLQMMCGQRQHQTISRSIGSFNQSVGTLNKDPSQTEMRCTDDFSSKRKYKFNRVDSLTLVKFDNASSCVTNGRKRILLGAPQLSTGFEKSLQIDQVKLSDLCFVQSITLPDRAATTVSCKRSGICEVKVPCVLPRLHLGFSYTTVDGSKRLFIDIHDNSTNLRVKLRRTSRRTCQITDWFDDAVANNISVTVNGEILGEPHKERNAVVQTLMDNNWFSSVLKTELKHFVFEVVKETLDQRWRVFPRRPKLKRICNKVVWGDPKVEKSPKEEKECTKCLNSPIEIEVKYSDDLAARTLGGIFKTKESIDKTKADKKMSNSRETLRNEEDEEPSGEDVEYESEVENEIESETENQ